MIVGYSFYSLCHFFRMVYQQLPVVHFREDFNVYVGVKIFQMLHLRLGNETLQRSVPVMDVGPVNEHQRGYALFAECLEIHFSVYKVDNCKQNYQIIGVISNYRYGSKVVGGISMKKIVIIILAILFSLPAFAQVGRYKNIRLMYPGYYLKLDTATGELSAIHYDKEVDKTLEEIISKKQSHNQRQMGRYELRRTNHIGTYQIFDTSSGNYTTVKWAPTRKNGEKVGIDIDSLVSNAAEGLKRFFKELEEDLEKAGETTPDSLEVI